MSNFTIDYSDTTDIPNVHIVHLGGDFDGNDTEKINKLQDFIDELPSKTTLIFSFTQLVFLTSHAIGLLVAWDNYFKQQGGRIIITDTNKDVFDVFAIVGVHNLIKFYPDLKSALEELK